MGMVAMVEKTASHVRASATLLSAAKYYTVHVAQKGDSYIGHRWLHGCMARAQQRLYFNAVKAVKSKRFHRTQFMEKNMLKCALSKHQKGRLGAYMCNV